MLRTQIKHAYSHFQLLLDGQILTLGSHLEDAQEWVLPALSRTGIVASGQREVCHQPVILQLLHPSAVIHALGFVVGYVVLLLFRTAVPGVRLFLVGTDLLFDSPLQDDGYIAILFRQLDAIEVKLVCLLAVFIFYVHHAILTDGVMACTGTVAVNRLVNEYSIFHHIDFFPARAVVVEMIDEGQYVAVSRRLYLYVRVIRFDFINLNFAYPLAHQCLCQRWRLWIYGTIFIGTRHQHRDTANGEDEKPSETNSCLILEQFCCFHITSYQMVTLKL